MTDHESLVVGIGAGWKGDIGAYIRGISWDMKGDGGGMGAECGTEYRAFAGGSKKFDVETIFSAFVGLNELAPSGLGLEEIRDTGAP